MKHKRNMLRVLAVACGALVLLRVALAQEIDSTESQPRDDQGHREHRRQVYVPIEELDVIVARDRSGVVLSKNDFEQLSRAARDNARQAPRVPAAFVLSSADYTAQIDGDHLILSASIRLDQFQPGWVQVPLAFENLSVLEANLNGRPAKLGRAPAVSPMDNQPSSGLVLFHDQQGAATLKLRLSTPLESIGSDKLARFTLLPAATAALSVSVPANRHLKVHGRTLERPDRDDQPTTYHIPVGGQPQVLLLFTGDQSRQTADSLTFASTGYGLHVTPGEVTWQAVTKLQVFGTPLNRLECKVPRSLEITDIESPGLESWKLDDDAADAQATQITLNYRQPFDEGRDITFRGVMAAPVSQGWAVPSLTIRSISSHVGRVVVRHPAGVRVRLLEASGARSAASDQASTLTFDIWREAFQLVFETQTHQREVLATARTNIDVNAMGVDLSVTASVFTLFAPLFDVQFRLPAEWRLHALAVNDAPAAWQVSSRDDGSNDFVVPLREPLSPSQELKLHLQAARQMEIWPVGSDPVEFALPRLELPQVATFEGALMVAAEEDLEVESSEVQGLDPISAAGTPARMAFAVQLAEYSGNLRLTRRSSRQSVAILTFARLDREDLHSHLEAAIEIIGGGVRNLEVQLPEAAGDDLRFQILGGSSRIVEQESEAPQNGTRLWKLELDHRVRGVVRLAVDVVQPRRDGKEFAVHQMRFPQADRVNGFAAIEAATDQQLTMSAVDGEKKPLAEVDPIDLPTTIYQPQQRIIAAYRFTSPEYAITLREERFERIAVPTSLSSGAQMETVLSGTGELQHRAEFQFVAVGVQALKLELPRSESGSSEIWAVLIDGRPVEVRLETPDAVSGQSFLVPLPPASSPDAQRRLTVFYRNSIPAPNRSLRWQDYPPVVSVLQSDGTHQPLAILQQDWRVHYPSETLLTRSDGAFEPVGDLDVDSLLGTMQQDLQAGTTNSIYWSLVAVAVAFIVVMVAIGIVRRHGIIWAAGILIALLFSGIILALTILPAGQHAREAAKRAESMAATAATEERYGRIDIADTESTPMMMMGAPATPPMAQAPQDASETARDEAFDLPKPPTGLAGEANRVAEAEKAPDMFAQRPVAQPEAAPMPDAAAPIEPQAEARRPQAQADQSRGRILAAKGGLLSLSLALEVPENSRTKEFRYTGNESGVAGVGLDVRWQDRYRGDAVRLFLTAATALLAWIALRLSPRWRAVWASLGLTLPLAIVAVAPAGWHPLLDGVFLGSFLAAVLWILRAVAHGLASSAAWTRTQWTGRWGRAAAMLLFAGGIESEFNTRAVAQEPTAPAKAVEPTPNRAAAIVPYDDAKDPLRAERVLLTRELFIELWNLAHPEKRVTAPAPVDGLLAAARYECELRPATPKLGAAVSVKATLILQNFRDKQIVLPIPLGAIAVTSAVLGGEPAPLRIRQSDAGQFLDVVLEEAGTHLLDLQFNVAAQQDEAVGQFILPQFPAPVGEVLFKLPEKSLSVRVNGSSSAFRRIEQNGVTYLAIPTDQGEPLTIAWRPPLERGAVDAIVNVDSSTAVVVDDAGLTHLARIRLNVPQGSLADATFEIPQPLLIRRIAGPHLAGWELNQDGENRRLRLFFSSPISDTTELEMELFQAVSVAEESVAVDIATVRPIDVTYESGTVAILASDDFRIRTQRVSGLRQIEVDVPAKFPQWSKRPLPPSRFGFGYVGRTFEIQILLDRQTAETVAVNQHAVKVSRRNIEVASRLDLNLKRVIRPSFSLELPEAYRLADVEATAMSDWYVTPSDGANPRTVTIEFKAPIAGTVQIVLQGSFVKGPEDLVAELLLPQPMQVPSQTTSVGVWFDSEYTATLPQSDGWRAVGFDQLPAELRAQHSLPPQFALRSTQAGLSPLAFDITMTPPRLAADAVVVTTVTDTALDYSLALKWKITGSKTDRFWFTTPAWLKDRLQVQGAGIRQVVPETVGERIRWTVMLWDSIADEYFALATATLPPPAKKVETPDVRFEQPTHDENGTPGESVELDAQRLFVMLVNQSQSQLKPLAADGFESITREDIPIVVNQELMNQAAEVLRIRDRARLPAWDVRKLEQQAGAPASVNLADLTIVLAADGTWRGQAVYTIRNRRRQFLPIRISEGSRLLSVFVQGQASRAMRSSINEQPVFLVPLPKSSESDLSFQVKLVFAGRFADRLPHAVFPVSRDFDLPAPDVVTQQESPEFGIPVARTLWTVYLPKEIDAAVIEDSARTNLTAIESQDTLAIVGRGLLQDAEQMLAVVIADDKPINYRQRAQARSNLKQLGIALPNYTSQSQDSGLQREFIEQKRLLDEKIAQNRMRIETSGEMASEVDGLPALDLTAQGQQPVLRFNNEALILGNSENAFNQFGLNVSEDLNRNGVLDPGEDVNRNGVLDFTLSANEGATGQPSKPTFAYALQQPDSTTFTDGRETSVPAKGKAEESKGDQAGIDTQQQRKAAIAQLRTRAEEQSEADMEQKSALQLNGRFGRPVTGSGGTAGFGGGLGGGSIAGGIGGGGGRIAGPVQRGDALGMQPPGFDVAMNQAGQQAALPGLAAPQVPAAAGLNVAAGQALAVWTQAGGLSLPVDLPTTSNKLTFSKISGKPKLALRLRSREVVQTGFSLIWTIVWLGVGATFSVLCLRARTHSALWKPFSWMLMSVGLLSFFMFTGPIRPLGFLAYLLGLVFLAVIRIRSTGRVTSAIGQKV